MNGLIVRPYRLSDAAPLAQVFHHAVHDGTTRHYDGAQRAAWSPSPPDDAEWIARLSEGETIVAEHGGRAVGFMTLDRKTGFLDFAYVAPDYMGRGVADTLYAVLEGRARVSGLSRLETEASLLAERFFARRGWQILRRQTVERGGVSLPNAVMEKTLDAQRIVAA